MATISGHKIRQAIERVGFCRKIAVSRFEKSIFAFENDEEMNPIEIANSIERVENLLASLQDLQERFNQTQTVTIAGEELALSFVIKSVGGLNRLSKAWKNAAELDLSNDDPYFRRRSSPMLSRDKEKDYASRKVTVDECISGADAASSRMSAYRTAIAEANSGTIEVPTNLAPLINEFLPGLLD